MVTRKGHSIPFPVRNEGLAGIEGVWGKNSKTSMFRIGIWTQKFTSSKLNEDLGLTLGSCLVEP